MSKINSQRKSCKDVFNAFLVENASYDSFLEMPKIEYGIYKPQKLISFSKAVSSAPSDAWIHFYEDDTMFERLWRNPQKYLPMFQRAEGVICPDFSLYRDMPLVMQLWNIYRSRAIGNWLQKNGIPVIANVRFGDRRTFKASCYGVAKNGTIAIGTHGCIRIKTDREILKAGVQWVFDYLEPSVVILYGTAPEDIFGTYRTSGVEIFQFDSEFSISRKERAYGCR